MRPTATILAILTGLAVASGDEIIVRRIPYANVTITDVRGGSIYYMLRGRQYNKPMSDVDSVELDGQKDFSDAEKDLAAGKMPEAVAGYDKAIGKFASDDWQAKLIHERRLKALEALRQTGRAVEDWLALVDADGRSRASLALAPTRLGPVGSATNRQAMELLEGRLESAKDAAFIARIKKLLLDLYTVEGKTAEIAMLRETAGPKAAARPAAGPASSGVDLAAPANMSDELVEVSNQIRTGQYMKAAEGVRVRLRRFSEADLPKALLLRGKALLLAYENGPSKTRQTLLEAGLCLMRVVASADPSDPTVPEALFLAASVCRHLGNPVAAQNAYRALTSRHGDTEWGRKAKDALGGDSPAE